MFACVANASTVPLIALRDALEQLMAALAAGDAAAALALVQQHPKLAWTRHDTTEDYPAHVAAAKGQGEVLAALLAAGEAADRRVTSLPAMRGSSHQQHLPFSESAACNAALHDAHAQGSYKLHA
jgi:hypothetical protein